MGKNDPKPKKPKDRISAADLVAPSVVVVLAATTPGSQGGAPVLDELTSYVLDEYDANGSSAAAQQAAVGLDDLVTGTVSLRGAAIVGVGWGVHHYLKNHGSHIAHRTKHHIFSLGG